MKFRLLIIVTACFIIGIISGWFHYKYWVEDAYNDLAEEIEKASIWESLFTDDPAILHLFYEYNSSPNDEEIIRRYRVLKNDQDVLVWRILRTHGIIRGDDGINKVGVLLRSSLAPIFDRELNDLVRISGVELLTELIKNSGRVPNRIKIQEDTTIEQLVVNFLAGKPYAFENYIDSLQSNNQNYIEVAVRSDSVKLADPNSISRDSGSESDRSSYLSPFGKPRQYFSENWGREPTMNDLVSLLYSNYVVSESFDSLNVKSSISIQQSNVVSQDNIEEYRQLTQFASKLIIAINNHPDVSEARNWLSVVEGPMQCLMLMVFWVSILFLLVLLPSNRFKGLNAKLEKFINKLSLRPEEEYSIKRTFRWGTSTLPIFGFIGTILGLMAALGDAYKIPLAPDETSSAIAISDITNTLSIAFTTTLMAFVLNVILSLFALLFLRKDVEDELQALSQKIN